MKTKKNRRAMIISLIIHMCLVLLVLFPLISMIQKENDEVSDKLHFIEIAFENGDMSPASASTKPLKEEKSVKSAEVVEAKESFKEKLERIKAERNSKVSEIEENSTVNMEEGENNDEIIEDEEFELNDTEAVSQGSNDSEEGEGEVGEAITGLALANMEFEGEGVFGRKIIYFANISKLAEKEGRVVVNLCINRAGSVTHIAFNRNESTLSDATYLRKVMRVATKYRFEADYTAPKSQCGKLTFIFKIG